jgi:hypothetical protein
MTSNETRQDRKQRYDQVVNTVARNTSPKQRPGVPAHALWITLVSHGSLSGSDARSAVTAAVDNGDLFRYTDYDDTIRYCPQTEDALLRLIEAEATREERDTELIARANGELQELRADDG